MGSAVLTVAALSAVGFLPASAIAQSLWTDQRADKSLTLELLKPDFDGPDNTTFATSVAVMSLRLTVGPRVHFVGEVPFAHFGADVGFGGQSENGLGNPYLGLEVRSSDSRVFGEFGLRLPIAPRNEATFVGFLTELDRWEGFLRDRLPVSAVFNYRYRAPAGFVTRLRLGPSVWIDAGDDADESELLVVYSGQAGYEGRTVSLLAGLSGRMIVTESDINVGERTLHQLGLALTLGGGRVRPGAQLRIPLDQDLTDVLDAVFGLSLTVTLP